MADWGATEWATAATVANAVLVAILVVATVFYAVQTLRTVSELREARLIETVPVLHWQRHPGAAGFGSESGAGFLRINIRILLTNYGRGPARILAFSAVTNQGEVFEAPELSIPSTLPAAERIELRLVHNRAQGDYPGERTVKMTLRYADAHTLRTYETRPYVTATWPQQGNSTVQAFDADERSPEQRRV